MHADAKLYLVFEFLDVDLKRYMEHANKVGSPITPDMVKVSSDIVCYLAYRAVRTSAVPPARFLRVLDACGPRSSRTDALRAHNARKSNNDSPARDPVSAASPRAPLCVDKRANISPHHLEIYLPIECRSSLLPLSSHPSSRSQTAKSADRQI